MSETPEHDDALDRRVKDALSHDPGEAYFASFADRVLAKIEAPTGQPVRQAGAPWWRWFGSPRTLAWLGSAAVLVLVGGVTFVMLREQPGSSGALVAKPKPSEVQQATPTPEVTPMSPPIRVPAPGAASRPADELSAQAKPPAESVPSSQPAAKAAPWQVADARKEQVPATANELRAREVRRDPVTGELLPSQAKVDSRLLARDRATAEEPATLQQKLLEMKRRAIGSMGQTAAEDTPAARSAQGFASGAATPPANPAPVLEETQAMTRHCGTVRDPQGRPLAGATVVLVESGVTATSGPDGAFCLDGPASATTVRVLSVGYRTRQLTLEPRGNAGPLAVTLDPVETVAGSRSVESGLAAEGGADALAPFAGESALARALVSRAAQRAGRARRDATAASWDAAAGDWSAALAALRIPAAQLEARSRLAETRFEAWRAEPSSERAARWREARDAFAAAAPRDPRLEREPWLEAGAIPR